MQLDIEFKTLGYSCKICIPETTIEPKTMYHSHPVVHSNGIKLCVDHLLSAPQ